MALQKIHFSEFLGQQLKEFRLQYKIKNKELATYIGKSTAYVSKLEKGLIQQVKRSDLVTITNYITGSDNGYELFCNKILSSSTSAVLDHDVSLINFDMINRQIPITQECKNLIKNEFISLSISVNELTDYINLNADLGESFFEEHNIDQSSIEPNVWYPYQEADSYEFGRAFIVLNYCYEKIDAFINGEINKCEYILPFVILYHILKYKLKKNKSELTENNCISCKDQAERNLLETGVYSLAVKRRMMEKASSHDEARSFLSSSDTDNQALVNNLLSQLNILSTYDVQYTNDRLRSINDNLENGDLAFSFAFMSTPISSLKELNSSAKKEFLTDVNKLIKRYQAIIKSSNNIELF